MTTTKAIATTAIILFITGCVFYLRDRSARGQLVAARTELTNLSNRVAELETSLADQQATNRALDSNLLVQAQQATAMSNRFDRAAGSLEQCQQSLAAAQAQTSERDRQLAAARTETADLRAQVEHLTTRAASQQRETEDLSEKLAAADQARKQLTQHLQKAKVQNTQLLLQLNDPILLRQQMSKLRRDYLEVLYASPAVRNVEAQSPDDSASHGGQLLAEKPRPPGGKGRLELQADGSVRLVREQ